MQKKLPLLQYGVLCLVLFNLLVLDYIFIAKVIPRLEEKNVALELESPIDNVVFNSPVPDICPNSCLTKIYQATASPSLVQSPSITVTSAPKPDQSVIQQSSLRDYYVPFGSGSSTASDWTDVAGLQAYVNISDYGSVKKVLFEASLHTPTGNQTAYARLYNKTDKHVVWLSEVSIEGGEPKLLTSSSLTLTPGNKLYQVQMKTQLQSVTNLQQARLKITSN